MSIKHFSLSVMRVTFVCIWDFGSALHERVKARSDFPQMVTIHKPDLARGVTFVCISGNTS